MAQSTKQNGHLVPSNSTVTTWTTPFVMTERKPFLANRIFDTFNALCEFVNNTSAAGEGTDAIDGLTLSVVNDNDKSKNGLYYVARASGDGGNGTTNNYIIQRVITSDFDGGTGSGVGNTVQVNSMISTGSYIVSDNKDISNTDTAASGMKVITGIYTTSDGKISYSYSYVYDPHDDHSSTGTSNTKVTFGQTDGSSTKVITNLKMNTNGSLTYTYIDLEYDKDHHSSNTGKYNSAGNKDLSNVDNAASGIKVIIGVNLSTSGTLSYTYSYIYNPHDDHSGSKSSNTYTALTGDNVEVISSVSLSADGVLSGTSKTLTHGNAGTNVGTYGLDATKSYTLDNAKFFVPELTVNAHGHVTAASEKTVTITHPTTYTAYNTFLDNANITITTGGSFKIPQWKTNRYGHVLTYQTDTVTISHGEPNSNSGTYGSSGSVLSHGGTFDIPRFTVNKQGHITAASNQTMTLPTLSATTAVIGTNSNKTYITVNGVKSNEIYISYANTASTANSAWNIAQFKNTNSSGKSELLFAGHSTGGTDPQTPATYYDRSIYVDHNNGNKLVSYGFCVAQANGSIYSSDYVVRANGSVMKYADMGVNSAYYASKLVNGRTISLAGAVTGSTTFDGSTNASITTTIDKHKLIINNIELNTDRSLKNYGGFIDFHYVNSAGNFVYLGIDRGTTMYDYSSRIIETAEGELEINGVKCVRTGITYATSFYQTSDINYKNIISYDCNLSVTDIANAPIIKFTWKESTYNSYQIGTIAQYWQTYLPESIGENGKLSLNYSVVGTISGIVNARKIVELEKENKELKQERKELKEKMDKILQYINI